MIHPPLQRGVAWPSASAEGAFQVIEHALDIRPGAKGSGRMASIVAITT
jgi:hypothetical protein